MARGMIAVAALLVLLVCAWMWTGAGHEIASLQTVPEGTLIWRGGQPVRASTVHGAILSGDRVQTPSEAGAMVLFRGENSRVEIQPGSQVELAQGREGKRIQLLEGGLSAAVAPQPEGQPMRILTPHAALRVMGTEFSVQTSPVLTRLEVLAGTVQFASLEDGEARLVNAGFFAEASPGSPVRSGSLFPGGWKSQDIGEVGLPGMARVEGDHCVAKGAGRNPMPSRDQFHFVYQALRGDGEIVAQVMNLEGALPDARAGVVIRQTLKPSTPHAFLYVRPGGSLSFERRPGVDGKTDRVGQGEIPCWLKLSRSGDRITAFRSDDGTTWTALGADTVRMGAEVFVGLGVSSWSNDALTTSVFAHVGVSGFTVPGAASP